MDGMLMQDPKTMEHLNHVDYPASKKDLVDACNEMSDVSEKDKKWFMENLPDKDYSNAGEVKQALSSSM